MPESGTRRETQLSKVRVLLLRSCRGITDVTGAETYLLNLLSALDAQRCEAHLVCITDPRMGETAWLHQLKVRGIPYETLPISSTLSMTDLLSLPALIKRMDAHIVHSIDHRADVVGVASAKWTGRSSVASFFGWTNWEARSSRARIYPLIDRWAMRFLDALITDSRPMCAQIAQGGNRPPTIVIPNGVDSDKFDSDKVQPIPESRFFPGNDHLYIGMVGRIHPNKGQLDFVKAARSVFDRNPQCRFLIIGDAPKGFEAYQEETLKFIRDHGMDDYCRITNVESAEIPNLFARLDILAAPSYMESFSFTLLEAMSMGLPIVTTHVGGNADMIVDGESGFLLEPGNIDAMVDTLSTLCRDDELRIALGYHARSRIEKYFSAKVMAERTMSLYEAVIDHRRTHPRGRITLRELENLQGR